MLLNVEKLVGKAMGSSRPLNEIHAGSTRHENFFIE